MNYEQCTTVEQVLAIDYSPERPDILVSVPEEVLASICDQSGNGWAGMVDATLSFMTIEEVKRVVCANAVVVWMHYCRGRSLRKIAEAFGCSYGTIKNRLDEAREFLRN